MTDGIYCLANDNVYDWAVAFLASLQVVAPQLPVVVIPYDHRVERLSGLRSLHPFEFWDDHATLRMLDNVGRDVNPRSPRTFRKLAAFWGPFERFVFLDSDVIVSRGIDDVVAALDPSHPVFLCGDVDMDQVLLPSPLRQQVEDSGAVSGFNTGMFASSRDALPRQVVLDSVSHVEPDRHWFVSGAQEQPFFNWCVWRSGLPVRQIAEAIPDASTYTGARRRPLRRSSDGTIRVFDQGSDDCGRRMLAVHWAGYRCTIRMPNRRLCLHYRLGQTSALEQATFLARWSVREPSVRGARLVASRYRTTS